MSHLLNFELPSSVGNEPSFCVSIFFRIGRTPLLNHPGPYWAYIGLILNHPGSSLHRKNTSSSSGSRIKSFQCKSIGSMKLGFIRVLSLGQLHVRTLHLDKHLANSIETHIGIHDVLCVWPRLLFESVTTSPMKHSAMREACRFANLVCCALQTCSVSTGPDIQVIRVTSQQARIKITRITPVQIAYCSFIYKLAGARVLAQIGSIAFVDDAME
jgi:hypothetical protein